MRLLVTSDFHGSVEAAHKTSAKAKRLEVDAIVTCGDITHFGSVRDAQRILAPLVALELPILYVPGNCDPFQLAEASITGAVNLHGRCQRLNRVSFIGLGGAPTSPYYSWFELSETQIMTTLKQTADTCPRNPWSVLVSHSPPIDTSVDLASSGIHAGSVSLRTFIEERKPNAVFCGHIHEARGTDQVGDTLIVNPGPVRHGKCAVADINEKIEVRLDSL